MAAQPTWLLCFDASTPRCVIALGRLEAGGQAELVAFDEDEGGSSPPSARLLGSLRRVAKDGGIEPTEIGAIACGHGPGTFTGTRVAVATAKGIALGLGLPLLGISTLAAMAMSAGGAGLILPLLDARRGEVYGALYEADPSACVIQAKTPDACVPLDTLVATLPAPTQDILPLGPGVAPYASSLPPAWLKRALPLPGPSAQGLFAAAVAAHKTGAARPATELAAVYLRKSYAELGVNPPKRPFVKSPFV